MLLQLVILNIILIFGLSTADLGLPPVSQLNLDSGSKSSKLPPCRSCSILVESFKKGVDRTARNKHDGGDAAWEEERLGSYKTSEVRLVEIQEYLCKDLKAGQSQCEHLAEEHEHLIEEWWKKHQDKQPDLHVWLCIEKLEYCCPPNHFGPNCAPCVDCNGNGKCKGNGTRKGNGKCACDKGYDGEFCNECAVQYYVSYKDSNVMLCSECHDACSEAGCDGAGPKACKKCKVGWDSTEEGCVDINECLRNRMPCQRNEFCVNSEGSFKCLKCDNSCNGCTGDGPDFCTECAVGYELKDGFCVVNKAEDSSEEDTDESGDGVEGHVSDEL